MSTPNEKLEAAAKLIGTEIVYRKTLDALLRFLPVAAAGEARDGLTNADFLSEVACFAVMRHFAEMRLDEAMKRTGPMRGLSDEDTKRLNDEIVGEIVKRLTVDAMPDLIAIMRKQAQA